MQIFPTRPTCLAKFETPHLEYGPVGTNCELVKYSGMSVSHVYITTFDLKSLKLSLIAVYLLLVIGTYCVGKYSLLGEM